MQNKKKLYINDILNIKTLIKRGDRLDLFFRNKGLYYAYTGFCISITKKSLVLYNLIDKVKMTVSFFKIVQICLIGGSIRYKWKKLINKLLT